MVDKLVFWSCFASNDNDTNIRDQCTKILSKYLSDFPPIENTNNKK